MRGSTIAILALAAAAILVVAFLATRAGPPTAPVDGKPRVVATFFPLGVFAEDVAGDLADVTVLLPPGTGPHEYSPTPGDVVRLADADVIVENGLGLETWLDGLVRESGTRARIVVASDGVPTRQAPAGVATGDSVPAEAEGAGGVDPHVWLDPVRAETMVRNVAEGLAAADPAHAAEYRANADAAVARLAALDRDFRTTLAAAPHKDFVAFHSAFGYLAARYGLTEAAVFEEFPGKEPSAAYLAAVVDLIRKKGITAIFSEPQFSPATVETVARETGIAVRALDTAETGTLAPDAYERVMRADLAVMADALAQGVGSRE